VIRQLDTWVLTAEWFDGDALRHGHAFFQTKRDAEAVGKALRSEWDEDFTYMVEKAVPYASSHNEQQRLDMMVENVKKEWDL
jgi:hypothetical protein